MILKPTGSVGIRKLANKATDRRTLSYTHDEDELLHLTQQPPDDPHRMNAKNVNLSTGWAGSNKTPA
jgi:hypothetical protein